MEIYRENEKGADPTATNCMTASNLAKFSLLFFSISSTMLQFWNTEKQYESFIFHCVVNIFLSVPSLTYQKFMAAFTLNTALFSDQVYS